MSTSESNTNTSRAITPLRILSVFAVIAVVAIGTAIVATDSPTQSETANAGPEEEVQRPTGAGTNPDGVVDERIEGLMNESATDDFVDSSSASDLSPLPGEPVRDGTEPATSAENVDPAVETGVDPVERMTEGGTPDSTD